MKNKMTDKDKIIHLMYYVIQTLGGDHGILAPLGSYGDTLDDAEILENLQIWLNDPTSYMKRLSPEELNKAYKWLDLPLEVGTMTTLYKVETKTND